MSAAVHLAGPADDDRLLSLMARFHEERGAAYTDEHRAAVAAPLLAGSPLGAIWLIGPQRAPLGYAMISFGWSVAMGGMIGWLEEIYIRPSVRGRGIGTEVLHGIAVSLQQADLRALHVRVDDDARLASFCARVGFDPAVAQNVMVDRL